MRKSNADIIIGYSLISAVFVSLLILNGFFNVGYLSDDYVNFYSATFSSIAEKFSSNLVFQNHLLLRPLWFLSFSLDSFIKSTAEISFNIIVISRFHNLLLYLLAAFLVSYSLYFKTLDKFLSLLFYALILVFPNNIHSLLWIVCRLESQLIIMAFLSLLLFLLFKKYNNVAFLVLSVIFFCFALLLKETAIIIPFIIFIINYKINRKININIIKDYLFYLLVLLLYIIYKVFVLNISANDILGYYSFNLLDRIIVIPKAVISLISSMDYISLIYNLNQINLINIQYLLICIILMSAVIVVTFKRKYLMYLLLLLLFLVSIIPNIIAGYFRPQLIFLPFSFFWLFILSDVNLAEAKSRLVVKSAMSVLIAIFLFNSFVVIKEYQLSFNKLKSTVNIMSVNANESNKSPVYLFLPSRLKQTYILDNVSATYNFYKYNDFVIIDTIQGFVNYAALDNESLNSEIVIDKINDNTLTALCSGKTQFFFNNDNNSISDFENDYIKCEFQKDIMFLNKCKKVKLTLKNVAKYNYMALTNNNTVHLNLH